MTSLGLLVAIAFFAYHYWQWTVQQRFCAKAEICLKESVFREQFRSRKFCEKSQESLEVRLRFSDCGETLDCEAWLRCGYGSDLGRKNPFPGEPSDFKKIQLDVDPNRYRP